MIYLVVDVNYEVKFSGDFVECVDWLRIIAEKGYYEIYCVKFKSEEIYFIDSYCAKEDE